MGKLLTVAIPTYNRADKLKGCLEKLLAEAEGKSVEVLVSDNASTDNTQLIMETLCRQHPDITYIRNAENIGPDRNFLNCYNRAGGEYVLLLGDDDMLVPGSMACILEALEKKPVFVHLNTSRLVSMDPLVYDRIRVPEGVNKVYHSRDALMQDMGICVTFMSSFILRNDLVQEIPDKERYIGTYFIQSHIALQTLATEGEYIFITKNCIAASANETVGYDLYFVWGRMYHMLLAESGAAAGIDPQLLQQIQKRDLAGTICGFVIHFRMTCPWSRDWKKSCILEQVRPYPGLYLRYLAILHLPVTILKGIRAVFKGIKRLLRR